MVIFWVWVKDSDVYKRQVLCILGPNGSGKTTLFKTIMKLKQPIIGKVFIDGDDISSWPFDKIAGYIGYIPQNYSPVFSYTCLLYTSRCV